MNEWKYRNIAVTPDLQRRVRLLAARLDIKLMDVVSRGVDLLEAQMNCPTPPTPNPSRSCLSRRTKNSNELDR